MTQEEKQILLKDLCARLPYGIKVKYAIPTLLVCVRNDKDGIKVIAEGTYGEHIYNIEDVKPYLRQMSSMTEEESNEYRMFIDYSYNDFTSKSTPCVYVDKINEYLDWLNAHHFDYRGLIEKGLAIEAPEGMYDLKEK